METLGQKVGAAIFLLFLALYMVGGLKTVEALPPNNASVYYDTEAKLFASPPCIAKGSTEISYGEVREEGGQFIISPNETVTEVPIEVAKKLAKKDRTCSEKGGFTGEEYTLMYEAYCKLRGKELPSRWTKDGDWKW